MLTSLYQNVLERSAAPSEIAAWQSAIDSGHMSVAQLLLGFSNSPEYAADTSAGIDAWFAAAEANAQAGLTNIYPGDLVLASPHAAVALAGGAGQAAGTETVAEVGLVGQSGPHAPWLAIY